MKCPNRLNTSILRRAITFFTPHYRVRSPQLCERRGGGILFRTQHTHTQRLLSSAHKYDISTNTQHCKTNKPRACVLLNVLCTYAHTQCVYINIKYGRKTINFLAVAATYYLVSNGGAHVMSFRCVRFVCVCVARASHTINIKMIFCPHCRSSEGHARATNTQKCAAEAAASGLKNALVFFPLRRRRL